MISRGAFLLLGLALSVRAGPADSIDQGDAAVAGTLMTPEVAEIRRALSPQIRAVQGKHRVPGIALALVQGGRTLWLEGFGQADKARGTRVSPRTQFRAGSLAKPLTAMGVLQLAEQGALDIDQPLSGYLPGFSIRSRFDPVAKPVTVRSVLCHHAGLPTDLNKGMWTSVPFHRVKAQLEEEYAAFPPFMVYSYSNVGYTLLGHMIEEVSGTPYADYMRRRLFEPLGMQGTGFVGDGSAAELATGYRGGRPFDLLPIRDLPAHGLYTTAADLAAFMRALLTGGRGPGGQIVARETLEEMIEPQNADVPLDLGILTGLGWFLEDAVVPGAGRAVRHGGTTLAFAAELILLPDRGLGVAVLANAQGSRPILSQLAEEVLARVVAGMEGPVRPASFLDDGDRRRHPPLTGEIAGRYATDFGLVSIRPDGPELCACLADKTIGLIPYPNGWFGIGRDAGGALPPGLRPLAGIRIQTRLIDGREVVVAGRGDRESIIGDKVPDTPIPEAWLARVGGYELLNPDEGFPLMDPQIRLRDGQLCMSYRMPKLSPKTIQVPIRPISDSEAIILGLGRTRGETLRAFNEGGGERLRYSGFIGRKRPEAVADGRHREPPEDQRPLDDPLAFSRR
jgi:CubicO group peptidase (beta-lactamase class C family)